MNSIVEYIILAFALAIPTMVILRECAQRQPIRLTKALPATLLIALEQTLLLLLGIFIANMLRFNLPEYDNLIYLGLLIVVALRMFFSAFHKADKERPVFDISRWGTIVLLGVATGTNLLFVGLAIGFRADFSQVLWRVSIPLLVIIFLLGYLSIMMGRQKKQMRVRRWQLIAVLFLLIFAVKGAFFS